ncbi:MAG: nuclear transport factor 2 family protein [Gammaproteobacteria bacterium]|nr:nuclear transport factor 2 family protein [Gammaproteobacteria bacterium]
MQKQNSCCSNKDLVLKFYNLACNERKVAEAANFLAENYIQHNPFIPDGRKGFITGLGAFLQQFPKRKSQIQRVIADGDLVVLHIKAQNNPDDLNDLGTAMVDIFRVENGVIVEHWDVVQQIPSQSASGHEMV